MPRYVDNPTPDRQLASLLASSNSSSLLDPKFARYLDSNDPLQALRYQFAIPTLESLERSSPASSTTSSSSEGVASSGSYSGTSAAVREDGSIAPQQSSLASTTTIGGLEEHTDVDDGYTSSDSMAKVDTRSPRQVRKDLAQATALPGDAQGNGTTSSEEATASRCSAAPRHSSRRPDAHDMIVYLSGNSLGLQSQNSLKLIHEELSTWQEKAVAGWFSSAYNRPWKTFAESISPLLAGIVGCKETEVVAMGTLTSNLHHLLSSFYNPEGKRYKILFEGKAFPSDYYAFASTVEKYGYDKKDGLIQAWPRKGEFVIRTEDILDILEKEGDSIAVVFFAGVNYFNGQVFEMQKITEAAHKKGCLVGWDLAHAAGNVPLSLHDWNVDFAVWCTYKYLNSGPGGVGALYVHEKHSSRHRLQGWWGNKVETRFEMAETFDPSPGAHGFQTSTPSILNMASLRGSLENWLLFGKEDGAQQESPASTAVAQKKLRKKSVLLTAYLAVLFKSSKYYVPVDQVSTHESNNADKKRFRPGFTIITPEQEHLRGAQLSILLLPRNYGLLKPTMQCLEYAGVLPDEREPDVIRFSPVPFYNTFRDCWIAASTFDWALKSAAQQVQGRSGMKKAA